MPLSETVGSRSDFGAIPKVRLSFPDKRHESVRLLVSDIKVLIPPERRIRREKNFYKREVAGLDLRKTSVGVNHKARENLRV